MTDNEKTIGTTVQRTGELGPDYPSGEIVSMKITHQMGGSRPTTWVLVSFPGHDPLWLQEHRVVAARPERQFEPTPSVGTFPSDIMAGLEVARRRGAMDAMAKMSEMLESWIKGVKENHEASGHRNENLGEECWRSFAAEDIRNMIKDVANELSA